MTHDHDRRDELASAHLDRETTPAEDAEIARDPALQARVDELRAVARRVAEPVQPPGDEARDAAVAAALGAAGGAAAAEDGPGAGVVTLARPARLPLRRRVPRPAPWLAAAAIIVVALALIPAMAAVFGGDDDDLATADMDAAPDAAEALDALDEATAEASGDAGFDARATAGSERDDGVLEEESATLDGGDPAGLVDLGPVADLDALDARVGLELRDRAQAAPDADGDTSPSPTTVPGGRYSVADLTTCIEVLVDRAQASSGEPVVLVALAELDGETVLVAATGDLLVVGTPGGPDDPGCGRVEDHRRAG